MTLGIVERQTAVWVTPDGADFDALVYESFEEWL